MPKPADSTPNASLKSERIQLKSERIQLQSERIQSRLTEVPGWHLSATEDELAREFEFSSSKAAVAFLEFVVQIAEDLAHQPCATIEGASVRVRTQTPEVAGLSETDFELAAWINGRSKPID